MRDHQQPSTIAILGADALAEGILARLLQKEGYETTILEASPTEAAHQRLEDVVSCSSHPARAPMLVGQIGVALERATASAGVLPASCEEAV